MGKLNSFIFVTLNGFYKRINKDISWHKHGGEEAEYSAESLKSDNILLFGRVTFKRMSEFWQSKATSESFHTVAKDMNDADKILISKT